MRIASALGALAEPLTGRRWEPNAVEAQIDRRVAGLRRRGIGRSDRVLIGYGNRLEFFADLLAIWQLGGCALPLDARLTPFELETLARASGARAFLHFDDLGSDLASRLDGLGCSLVDSRELGEEAPEARTAAPFALDDDALILFTSGTTGNPKGVVHTHRSLRARWSALRSHLGLEPYRRTLCLLPTHFGHGLICNALFPWLSGQELHVLPPFTPDVVWRLGELVDRHGITFFSSVPAVWRLALRAARAPEAGSLRRVSIGSAPLSAQLWNDVRRWTGTKDVLNAYGITETGSWVAGTTVEGFEPADGLIGVGWGAAVAVTREGIGEAPPGVGETCAVGESGYVWLQTPALMRGYLDRDDLTAECVRAGWFLTGDLGFVDERGWLTLHGRVRDEINKGGAKVYPADIEAVAEGFPGLADLCCFAIDDPNYGQNVGLALVLDGEDPARLRALHGRLRERLADHQMPVRWFLLDELPRTSRGKIQRDRIAALCSERQPVDLRALLSSE